MFEIGICKYCGKKICRKRFSHHWRRYGWPKQWKDECKGDNIHYPLLAEPGDDIEEMLHSGAAMILRIENSPSAVRHEIYWMKRQLVSEDLIDAIHAATKEYKRLYLPNFIYDGLVMRYTS